MRKKILFAKLPVLVFLLLLVAGIPAAYAQNRTVSGRVTDANDAGIPGVTVLVKGTSVGTSTNSSGNYTINVPAGSNTLVYSYIGFAQQEVNVAGRSNVDVSLKEDAGELESVVVTALGIERSTKALQFSATQVNGENLTQAREISTANALAGRVAGVNVSKIASGPGGSSRVVIRGAKTLGSTLNQPLYVVDGVPIDNTNQGQAGMWGGSDQGDGMNSINPDDIATITVLKGAGAAALYGSRAANGVILITTKKGAYNKGLGVELNSNYVLEKVQNLTDFQKTHGNGGYVGTTLQDAVAEAPRTIEDHWDNWWGLNAWGPRFDGSQVVQFDGISREYSYKGDNWDRFYKTGNALTNSVALSGGNENHSFRLSLSDLRSTGVFPNTGFDRKNVTLSTNSKVGKKITVNSKIMYANEQTKNRPRVSDSPGNGNLALFYVPGDVDVRDYYGDPNKPGAVPSIADQAARGITIFDKKAPGEEFQASNNLWQQNPYWAAYQYINSDTRDRVIASGDIRYNITDFLYLSGTAGMDWYTLKNTNLEPQGTGYNRNGAISEDERRAREINIQYLLGFDKSFGKIGVNAFFGGNQMRRTYERVGANGGGGFTIPFLAAVNNAAQRNFTYDFGKSGINSLFSSVELSYNDYLFITGTARKDWFSVLNPADNSIIYPSIGASFVFSDAFQLPTWMSLGKVRLGWAQVGNVSSVGPYSTNLTYSASASHVDRAGNPVPLGVYSSGDNLPNPNLKPFTSTESEFGLDVRFFNNRLGLDITYYDQKTTNDILNASVSQASGFRSSSVNLGQIGNKGIEFLLTGTPVKGNFTWDVSLNFSKNKSEVISLIEGQKELQAGDGPRTETVFIKHIVGYPYGMITGIRQARDPQGNLVYDEENGAPIAGTTFDIIGKGVPDFTGGINNSFTWKGLNLTFLVDFKSGGDIYSGTNVRMTQAGFTKRTLQGRAGEAPLTITGVSPDGTGFKPFTKTLTPGEAQNYWGQLGSRAQENFMYDASYAKLRQLTLGYNIPSKIWGNAPIRGLMVSFVARNLAILYKNTENIDPESNYSSANAQGLDYFGMPASRTYGFNIRATF
jgi:TonB-linked SusC/RagA family outer membrane protein